MRNFASPAEVLAAEGSLIGVSHWHTVSQEMIDGFADITDDHQWIHVDRERAASGPFGGTVAHGYLMLALIPSLVRETFRATGARMTINYGLERVRFPSPLRAGAEIRAQVRIASATSEGDGRVRVVTAVTITARHAAKPCCVAETVSLFVFP